MEFLDLSASDMSIENAVPNNENVPNELNFSVESSFVDDAESLNIPVPKKTRKRFIWIEDKVVDNASEAYETLKADGFTMHCTKNCKDGTKTFFRCDKVIARSKTQC